MIRFALAFVAGCWLLQFQPRLPDPGLFVLYAALLLGACWLPAYRLPALLVLGFAWAHGHALLARPATLPPLQTDWPVWATGRIDSLVEAGAGGSRFVLRIGELQQAGRHYRGEWRVRVGWYRDTLPLAPGELWRLSLRLRPASGYANPGGFDHQRWLYQQGIAYTAAVVAAADNRRLDGAPRFSVTGWRQRLGDVMAAMDGGGAGSALLRALVVGDRRGFTDAQWRMFTNTGTNHLVAISGLHVGLVAGLVTALVAGVWRRLPAWCARWPALLVGSAGGAGAALVYAALAGFAIPTQRALLMLGVALWALAAGRASRSWDVLAVALVLVVAWSPMAVLSPGTWLSFGAVAAILLALAPRRTAGSRRSWQRWPRLQFAVTLGLAPLLLLFFQQASLIAPLVNLVAVPWFSLLLVPLALLATLVWVLVPGLGESLWRAWLWLAEPTIGVLQGAAKVPWAAVNWPMPGALACALALAGVAVLLAPRGVPARAMGAVLLLPGLLLRTDRPPHNGYELTLLDVGQGLAVVVQTARHTLVYDAGPRFRSGFNTGSAVVLPFLRQRGIRRLDTLVVSHGDSDHAGGVAALRSALPIGRVLAGEAAEVDGALACVAGQAWRWDGVSFEMLHPDQPGRERGNNASCVLRISAPAGSALLSGDIEAPVERRLLAAGRLAPTEVVIVPHHGSRSSSTPAFVAALAPDHVLYATGRDNRWGFPRPRVVARWSGAGAQGWNTASEGALTVEVGTGDQPIRIRGHRRRHYWQP